MKIKQILCLVLVLSLTLTGCSLPGFSSGTLSYSADNVQRIDIANPGAETSFTVQDRSTISDLIKLINGLRLDNEVVSPLPVSYTVTLTFTDDTDAYTLSVLSDYVVVADGKTFDTDAQKLHIKLEKLECDVLTDIQLIDRVFTDDYWDTVSIKNEKGNLSVDKILALPDQCPALFELVSRPSMLKSLANSGMDLLQEYANSANTTLRERAKKLGDILSTLIPDVKDKIESILND